MSINSAPKINLKKFQNFVTKVEEEQQKMYQLTSSKNVVLLSIMVPIKGLSKIFHNLQDPNGA
jgi:hypothetical protein